jgi:hypothetical protein
MATFANVAWSRTGIIAMNEVTEFCACASAGYWEPRESRGSRTVLKSHGVEIIPRDSPMSEVRWPLPILSIDYAPYSFRIQFEFGNVILRSQVECGVCDVCLPGSNPSLEIPAGPRQD